MGMNNPTAVQNGQFALNVMHWLIGVLEPGARAASCAAGGTAR